MKHFLLCNTEEDYDQFLKGRDLSRSDVRRIRQLRDIVGIEGTLIVLPRWDKDFWIPGDITRIREQIQHGKNTGRLAVVYFRDDGKGGYELPL